MSTGIIVDIDRNNIGIDSMHQEVLDTINYSRDFADEMREELVDGIKNLNDVVQYYKPTIDVPSFTSPVLDGPGFPAKPTFGPLDIDNNWPTDIGPAPIMQDYGNLDFDYVTPTPPDEISGDFNWHPDQYTSDMWFALFSKVHTWIIDGGTGLTDTVHAAIISRDQEARRVATDRAYRNGIDAIGANGFNLPSGQIGAFQRDISTEIIAKDMDALNLTIIKDFDMATENTRFAITTGLELEKVLRSTYDLAQTRSLDAAKAAKEFVIAVYAENIKAYVAKWEGIRLALEALKTKVDAISAYNEGNIKVFLGKAEVFESQIKAIASKNASVLQTRNMEVTVYGTEVEAVAKQYSALVEEMKVNLEVTRLEVGTAIEESKLDLQAYSDKAKLSESVATAVSNIASQSVASALGAINTNLSNSYSGSENRGENWSHSDSLSESHNFADE